MERLQKLIRDMFVQARVFGEWPSLRVGGGGVEFGRVVPFREGDPEEDLDPLASAQYGRPMLRRTYPLRRLECVVVLDTKATMSFGSGDVEKHEAARAVIHECQRIMVELKAGLSLVYKDPRGYRIKSFGYQELAEAAAARRFAADIDFSEAEFSVTEALRKLRRSGFMSATGVFVILSDFLHAAADYEVEVRLLRRRNHELFALAIADPWELEPPTDFFGGIMVRDVLTGKLGLLEKPHDYLKAHKELFDRNNCPFEVVKTATGGTL